MAKKNRNYWRDRAEEHKKIVDKDTEQVIRETREAYERSLHHIDGEIARWYQRFADAEEITVEEARQQMTAGELNRYRMTLEEYIARGEQLDLDSSWATALEKASALHHIDRYDALRTIIRAEIEELKAKTRGTSWMDMIAEDAYNHMIYALSREAGLAIGFNQPAIDRLKMLIKSPWAPDGIDFARRVDMNMDKLAAEITKKLQQAFITGQPYRELAADIEKTVGLKQYEAERIIRTESTQISSHAEQAAYNTAGIEQYEILVTLDDRTCELCGLMDKTVEDVEKMEPGVNAPPFHPNCRCTTVGHYDDGIDETRIARDEDGNPIHVDGDMTWEEWKAQYRGQDREGDIKPLTQDPNRRILDSQRSLFQEEPNVSIPEKYVGDFADFNELTIQEQEKVALREMKEITARCGFEYGKIIHEGGETRYFTSKMESSVKIPDNLSSMKGAHVLHTHSNVTPFSAKDFRLLIRDNVERLTVIAGNGDVYSVTIGEGYRPDIEEYIEASDRIRALVDMEMMSRPEFFEWTPEERVYMATKEQAFQTARYFKWNLEGGRI